MTVLHVTGILQASLVSREMSAPHSRNSPRFPARTTAASGTTRTSRLRPRARSLRSRSGATGPRLMPTWLHKRCRTSWPRGSSSKAGLLSTCRRSFNALGACDGPRLQGAAGDGVYALFADPAWSAAVTHEHSPALTRTIVRAVPYSEFPADFSTIFVPDLVDPGE